MTSTQTPGTPSQPSVASPTLRLTANGTIILMTSLTTGMVVFSADVSLPVGYYQTTWSGTTPYVGEVKLNQAY